MNYYNNIKELLINNEITKKVKNNSINKSDMDSYYRIGKELKEAGKHYGEGIIKKYAVKLTYDLGKNYNERTLRTIRQFYEVSESLKWSTLSTVLSWSHYKEVLPLNDINEINYYINKATINNLSVRQLRKIIKSDEYNRLPSSTKEKIINNKSLDILDNIKDPIHIYNVDRNKITEKYLQDTIVENISSFMEQLGDGYSYVGSEYPIKIGDNYNYIDILLFNIKYNCYVVVELKVTKLTKDHIGQTQVYMNYIDKNIKNNNHDKTIGLIIVKENDEYVIKYSSDERIKSIKWEVR